MIPSYKLLDLWCILLIIELCFWIFRILYISIARIICVSMLIWTNEIIDIETYRIYFLEFFVFYDIVISDQSWYYNIIILIKNFYAFSLSLPKVDLDLMHRILYVWVLTKVKFKYAIIVILNLYTSFRILWSNAMSYVNAIPELNGQNYGKWFLVVTNCSSDD